MFRSYYSVFKVRLGDVPQSPVSRNFEKHHMVGQNGLEPSTSRLSVVCSSQLSYWPMWWRLRESNPWPPACKAGALPAELNPHIRFWVTLFQGPQNRTISTLLELITCSRKQIILDVSVPRVPSHTLCIHVWVRKVFLRRFPHSEICGSMDICSLPQLIAAYHVFHRLSVPRHPPYALYSLTW